jgi:hypothetical protein
MAELNENTLRDILARIDPTQGLVEYVKATKPYHTKIMDVLIEYVYEEQVDVTVGERYTWRINLAQPDADLEYACGYGLTWDSASSADANPNVVIDDIVPGSHVVLGTTSTDGLTPGEFILAGKVISQFPAGSTFRVLDSPYSDSAYTTPSNITEFTVDVGGATYVGGNTHVPVVETLLVLPPNALSGGRAYARIGEPNTFTNSMLVTAASPYAFSFTPINLSSNQFAVVDRVAVVSVVPASKQWTIQGNKVADIGVGTKIYVTSNTGNGNGTYTVQAVTLVGLNTQITTQEPIFATATGTGFVGIPIRASDTYNIIGVNPALRRWTVTGSHLAGLIANQVLEITGAGAGSGKYLVDSAVISSGNTVITVKGSVNPSATASGTMEVQRLPRWASGTKIEVSGTGILPVPLVENTPFYFIPQTAPGVFNLAYRRYPRQLTDYVNITTTGTGEITIQRAELYYPGAVVRVSNTFNNTNDGIYFIKDTQQEGAQTRLTLMQALKGPHGGNFSIAGTITTEGSGFDEPTYCPVASASALHTDLFIHELLQFTISMDQRDSVASVAEENSDAVFGWGVEPFSRFSTGPYGADSNRTVDVPERFAVTSGISSNTGGGVVLPHGFDVQAWDVGGMGGNLSDVQNFYERTIP